MSKPVKPTKTHYIHRVSAAFLERIVGIFVLSAILIVVGLVVLQLQSSHLLDDRIYYHAYLNNAQGVSTETVINISGIEVGQVKSIDITDDNRIHVYFFIYDSFQRLLRTDSTGALNKLSVIGNAAIIISAGSHHLPILPPESTIPVEEPVTVEEMMAKLTPVIISLNDIVENVSALIAAVDPDQVQLMTGDLAQVMNNLEQITQHVAQGKGMIGKVLYDEILEQTLSSTISGMEHLVKDASGAIRETKKVIKGTQSSLLLVDDVLRETEVQIQSISLVIDPAVSLLKNSDELVSDFKPTSKVISNEAKALPEMVNKMQLLLDSTNRTLQNAQQVWPLSSVIPETNKTTQIKGQPLDD